MAATIVGPLADKQELIGETYDLALGYVDPTSGNVTMYGYVMTPGTEFEEATNLQDEEHLVQIASPLSTDRYGRFPKVSQGDWSGGERQLIFVNGNQYYSSTYLETSVPGHLTCYGAYSVVVDNIGAGAGGGSASGFVRPLASDADHVYYVMYVGGSNTYYVSIYNLATQTFVHTSTSTAVVEEYLRGGDAVYLRRSDAVYQVSYTGTLVQVANDAYPSPLVAGTLAQFNGSLYYIFGSSSPNTLKAATYPFPTLSTVLTCNQMEGVLQCVCDSGSGLVFATSGIQTVIGAGQTVSFIYTFDGANPLYIGKIEAAVIDMVYANGVVYILTTPQYTGQSFSPGSFLPQPTIYQLSGQTITPFDDFRYVDPAFQAMPSVDITTRGNLDTDGTYLYLFYPGLSTKRYSLTTQAVSDVGNQVADGTPHFGIALPRGGFIETQLTSNPTNVAFYLAQVHQGGGTRLTPNRNGVLYTSWFDFGTPGVLKVFRSIEFAMNSAIDATAITVEYRIDSNPFAAIPVVVSQGGNTLIATLPARAIGERIQFQITLVASKTPDVQSYSVLGELGRVWTVTVACRRGQTSRNPSDQPDPQGTTPQALIANIMNAKQLAAGNVVLWMPDPTVNPTGGGPAMIQVNAVIQDYTRTSLAPAGAGGSMDSGGGYGFDADVKLTLTEAL